MNLAAVVSSTSIQNRNVGGHTSLSKNSTGYQYMHGYFMQVKKDMGEDVINVCICSFSEILYTLCCKFI